MVADDRVGVEGEAARQLELQMRSVGGEPDTRLQLLAVAGQSYRERELALQPGHEPGEEAGGPVLNDEDRDCEVGWKPAKDVGERPRPACRGADTDPLGLGWRVHCAPTS